MRHPCLNTFQKFLLIAVLMIGVTLTSSSVVMAGKSDNTLNVAFMIEGAVLDPYNDLSASVHMIKPHVWDGLLDLDPKTMKIRPMLAKSYKYIDDVTLDFELRRGVKFHDGTNFDADDVVYTLNWVSDPKNKVVWKGAVRWIKKAVKLNRYKVRVHLKNPNPVALQYFAYGLMIYPEGIYDKEGPRIMNKKPIGTGPYKVTKIELGKEFVLERFDGHFKGSPKGRPAIKKIVVRIITESTTQMAEIMSGGLDWIWKVPSEQAEDLAKRPNITVKGSGTMRFFYLLLDAAGKTGDDSPFKKLKVRQAVSYAIDREAIARELVGGKSEVIHSFCFPTNFGCPNPSDVTTYEYNPKKAKKLLAEAGYPNGFKTKLAAWRDRPYAEAMLNNLAAIGIESELIYLKIPSLKELWFSGKLPMIFGSWGSTINDAGNVVPVYFTGGLRDIAQDGEVKKWLIAANTTSKTEVRRQNFHRALKKIAHQAYTLPLFTGAMNFAFTTDLDYVLAIDGRPYFYLSKWK